MGIGKCSRRVAVLDPVVVRLDLARVSGETSRFAQVVEPLPTTCQEFVRVGLMSCVEQDRIVRRPEDAMEGNRQLDDP